MFAQQGTGLIFDDKQYEKVPIKAPLVRSLGNSIPKSASLKKYAPIPKSQGSFGTCVGWSTAYAARTIIEDINNGWTDKATITNNTFSPGFIYKHIKSTSDNSCKFGASIKYALDIMKEKGVPKYNDLSINCPNSIISSLYTKASKYKIKSYAKLFGKFDGNNYKISATKKSIAEKKPVVIGMKCPSSFSYTSGCWSPTENHNNHFGGHAMCVIGYDDNKYGGAFEIQNSWGENWGNKGYIWIKYSDYANFTKYAYELIYIPKPKSSSSVDLSGSIKLKLDDGFSMKAQYNGSYYNMTKAYSSGTNFRIYISNKQPAFVYAFGSDETKKVFQIFPHKPGISAALTYKQNDVAIPSENHYIQMDNTIGNDYLCVLYSKSPLNIKDIMQKIENQYGTFNEKVKKVIGSKLVNSSNITYSKSEIGFDAKSKGKSVVAIILKTKHIN